MNSCGCQGTPRRVKSAITDITILFLVHCEIKLLLLLMLSLRLAEYTFQDLQYTEIPIESHYASPKNQNIVQCFGGHHGHLPHTYRNRTNKVSIDSSTSLEQNGEDCKTFQLMDIEIH
jgi:hypothetical protein